MYESLFVLYLLSGVIKQFFLLFHFSLPDITLISLIVILAINLIDFSKYGYKIILGSVLKKILLLFFIIFLLLSFSIFYTDSAIGQYYKIILYIIVAYSFFIPFNKKEFDMKLFLRLYIALSLFLGLMYLYYYPKIFLHDYNSLESSMASLYLTVGYLSGLAILLLIKYNKLFIDKMNIFLILIFIFILIVSGARGPLLFLSLSLMIFFMINRKTMAKKIPIVFIIAFISFFILNIFISADYIDMINRSSNRFSLFFAENSGNSVNTRVEYIAFSLNEIFKEVYTFFFGFGVNSYGIISSGVDRFAHPHNIFLEVFFELGILGLFVFILLFFFFAYYLYKYDATLFPIFLYLLLNAMKSSSYVQSRILFGVIGILFLIILSKNKFINKEGT